MEFSLHRQLKEHYAGAHARFEVPVDGYRIDLVNGCDLFEIQHGSLAAIRDKIHSLLSRHPVHVVKPIIARRRLVKRKRRGGCVASRRWSPRRGTILDLFDALVYFTPVFPHRRLTLHVPLVEIEEWRYPGHGKRRWRRQSDFQIEDQTLTNFVEEFKFRRPKDLLRLLPPDLPQPFHTGQLAEAVGVPRSVSQRVAYCLRETGAVRIVGKLRNAHLYQRAGRTAA